jgi:hypothetical protein
VIDDPDIQAAIDMVASSHPKGTCVTRRQISALNPGIAKEVERLESLPEDDFRRAVSSSRRAAGCPAESDHCVVDLLG